jgi:CHAD domain-containing protein
MAYQLKRKESAAEAIRRIADEEYRAAQRGLRAGGRPAIVHRARQRLKKLRSVLRLVRPAIGGADFDRENQALREAGRTLARLRDADMLVNVVRTLTPPRGSDAAFRKVVARVRQRRQRVHREFARAGAVAAARTAIAESHGRLERWAIDTIDDAVIAAGLRKSIARVQRAAAAAARSRDDTRWHEWRKRTKDVWYHLRLVRSVWPIVLDCAAGQVRQLADDLGDDHDLAVVAGHLPGLVAGRGGSRELARLRLAIERRRRELQDHAREQAAGLLAGTPRAFVRRFEVCWKSWRG